MMENIPFQTEESKRLLIDALNSPLWTKHPWQPRAARANEANLQNGVRIKKSFDDPQNLLEKAYQDLEDCFHAGSISLDGNFEISTELISTQVNEAFQVIVSLNACRIQAADVDGIRRGIFYIEDEMCRARGPFLPLGTFERSPLITRRIARCHYGPIKRPGNHAGLGDELLDDMDYYPDQYLNRLAHEGVNGLWITLSSKDGDEKSVGFGDLVSTFLTPDAGASSVKRFNKLRQVVEKCARYGIRIYLKTMEPHVCFAPDDPRLEEYPDLAGNLIRGQYYLCASGQTGQRYLYEAVNKIFSAVPGLGGIINISHGELYTTCLSALPATGGGKITCPRCSKIAPAEILHASLSAMQRGMRDATPEAELISWLYMPQPQWQTDGFPLNLAEWVYEIPAHTPEGVILQFNFESGVRKTEFGKELVGGDYWLSQAGPSERFERIAANAQKHKTRVAAKIQTGTSYEIATVPYVAAPSQLYQKFTAMHRLGITHVMLNWIVGNAPGMMHKAAGELSFAPLPSDESNFMHRLASLYWKEKDIPKIVQAWEHFSEGYGHYPLTNLFQYYGPMNDGPVWPLLLKPQDTILSPTYQLGSRNTSQPWPPSGDRVGECFTNVLTLEETVELCRLMSAGWDRGLDILHQLKPEYADEPERVLDIDVATAMGILLRSGYNILRFYLLREEMLYVEGKLRLQKLQQLISIIQEEQELSERLASLCEKDARLGFHPDAEGYKYFPEKLRWRIRQLQKVLDEDVLEIQQSIDQNELLFPQYTGKEPTGAVAYAVSGDSVSYGLSHYDWQRLEYGIAENGVQWAAGFDAEGLIIKIKESPAHHGAFTHALIKIEPHRLCPAKLFFHELHLTEGEAQSIHIPFEKMGLNAEELHPIRMDVRIHNGSGEFAAWRPQNSLLPRLLLGSDNPADLGWLIFKRQ